ncbi:hypothetical protein FRC09_010210 [Ceratobasidium sp. 395]|nr:hypothetical protein FRC09_010210 [Ceratobasidium sp. 395]
MQNHEQENPSNSLDPLGNSPEERREMLIYLTAQEQKIRILLAQEQRLRVNNPATLPIKDQLASIYVRQMRIGEAQRVYLSALDIRRQHFQWDHPDILKNLHDLADTYSQQGLWHAAENLKREILNILRQIRRHKDNFAIINCLYDLTCICIQATRYPQAKQYAEQAYNLSRDVFGDPDPLTTELNELLLRTSSDDGIQTNHPTGNMEKEFPIIIKTDTELEEIFSYLKKHDWADLTEQLNMKEFSEAPYAGGHFGDVWCGRLKDGTQVAVKCLRLQILKSKPTKEIKRTTREVYHWSKLKHKHVLDLTGIAIFRRRLAMISPWMVNGTLSDYVQNNPDINRWKLCIQVAEGLAYIHGCNMIHGDLKAKNVLVSEEGLVKLTDFGNSIMLECSVEFTETTNRGGGTYRWMAPELLDGSEQDSTSQADVYALGMTMLEVMTGKQPFPERAIEANVILHVNQGGKPLRPVEFCSETQFGDKRWNMLSQCWQKDTTARPTAQQVLELVVMSPMYHNTWG